MMNVKETLKRLHEKYPTLSLDELFDILDCYVDCYVELADYCKKNPITTYYGDFNTNSTNSSLQLKAYH